MTFFRFLKDKVLLITLLTFSVFSIEILILPYKINFLIRIYITIFPIMFIVIGLLAEYTMKKRFYNELKKGIDELEDKYLISEIVKAPDFTEGKILKETIQDISKSMIDNVNYYKFKQEDYKEYIELWIHEIKTPIATSKMIIENNKNEVTKSIEEEIDKVENYIEQALFYARSNTVEKDYIISKSNLKEIVNNTILKNKSNLISNKVIIDIHNLDTDVYTDSKWVIFILNQIIQNSLKYFKENEKKLEIYSVEQSEKVILYIKDNGIGIAKKDVERVFEKGFTGKNRKTNK